MRNRYIFQYIKDLFIIYLLFIYYLFMNKLLIFKLLFLFINLGYCNFNSHKNHKDINEYQLREKLFQNYSANNIPILKSSDNIFLKYGLQIENLEYFNQVGENIKFNILVIQQWSYNLLTWNNKENINSVDYITLLSYQVWKPDLELYNAAEKPVLFDDKGGLKLYNNGTIYYNRPTKYSFSCKLNLKIFPFDTQKCEMTFGSWKYTKKKLDLSPFNDSDLIKNISVNPSFSHNEWNIINVNVVHEDIEYLCCPGEYYPNSVFTIHLKRNYQKYMIVIIMTIFITLSDFFVTFIKVDNYKRTFILVFIPLTLLWLQIYIASKIPVIKYPTLMETILLSCFIITILNAIESGLLYILITNSNNKKSKIDNIPSKIDNIPSKIDNIPSKSNIKSYFEFKDYEFNLKHIFILNFKNTFIFNINNIHNFDTLYRLFMVIFFSIYIGILVDTS